MGQIIAPCRLIVEESAAKYNLQTMGTKKQASLGMSDCWTIRETSGKKTFSFLGSLIIMGTGFKIQFQLILRPTHTDTTVDNQDQERNIHKEQIANCNIRNICNIDIATRCSLPVKHCDLSFRSLVSRCFLGRPCDHCGFRSKHRHHVFCSNFYFLPHIV